MPGSSRSPPKPSYRTGRPHEPYALGRGDGRAGRNASDGTAVGVVVGLPSRAAVLGGEIAGGVAGRAEPPDEHPTAAAAKRTTAVRA
ncbi:hypothetical protein GCM10023196_062120 [Actinoallomurus vinaceus]|uniref:Uncharacterized protein n=1 Tax=Actinoallomurus vinaceus TaxID=1080074 RepID=A0ABP8UJR6_9ACTN